MEDVNAIGKIFNGSVSISMEKLYVELTNRCNLKCIHCYNESNSGCIHDLPFELVKSLIDAVHECGLSSIALSGGEALLYPRIEDVFKYCNKLGVNAVVLTNGTYFFNSEYYDILIKYQPDIQVSLDGPDKQSNDSIRGVGSFDNAIKFISVLRKDRYSGEISANTVITEYTMHNYAKMVGLCNEMCIDRLTYSMITSAGRAKNHKLQLDDSDLFKVVKDINSNIKLSPENKCQGIGVSHECSLKEINNNVIRLQPKVTCCGDVFPCQMHNMKEYVIGNIYTENLMNVLNSDASRRFLTLMYLRDSFMQECVSCIFSKMCKRGCMAKAINDTGNPFSTDNCCIFYKETFVEELKKASTVKKII